MCGIAGFVLAEGDRGNAITIAHAMLAEIEVRGRDACGAAWVEPGGTIWFQKSRTIASKVKFDIDPDSRVAILHTRAATQGDAKDHANNHPLCIERADESCVFGVHNGVISNEAELWRSLTTITRKAQVDSEVIFATIAEKGIKDSLEEIEGTFAIAWLDSNNTNEIHLARGRVSPLFVARTKRGSMFFASTLACINKGIAAGLNMGDRADSHRELKVGNYLRIAAKTQADFWDFMPKVSAYTSTRGKTGGTVVYANSQDYRNLHVPSSAIPKSLVPSEYAYWVGVFSRMDSIELWAELSVWQEVEEHLANVHKDQLTWHRDADCDECFTLGANSATLLERDLRHARPALLEALAEAETILLSEKDADKVAELAETNPVQSAALALLGERLDSGDVSTTKVPAVTEAVLSYDDAAFWAES